MRLQEKIYLAVEKFCAEYPNDREWPKVESFCLDQKPKIHGRYLLWGWGRQSGRNPQNYSWVIYDPRFPDRVQLSWKRGNYDSTRDIYLETGESVPVWHDGTETVIEFPTWSEDCTDETSIENQLEKAYVEILNQLLQGKDVQISFQHSRDRLHVKTVQVKKII